MSRIIHRAEVDMPGNRAGMPRHRRLRSKSPPAATPRWDGNQRKLWFGDSLVKHFRRRAPMAEVILASFEEEAWNPRIDDPLPPLDGRRESDRLRNQVQALNRRLENRLIRFFMDGTGQGVCWEPASSALQRRQ